jgi:hypothetical protein
VTTDLILTRDTTQRPAPLDLPPRFALHQVTQPTDGGVALLDQLYTADGFPKNWPMTMLERGAHGVVLSADGVPAASAWLIRKPFYVKEIRRTFDAGLDADYYFGDFVAPSFRGEHLQRLLIRARSIMSHEAGRHWAIAMTRATIPASRANYIAEGFSLAAEIRTCRFFRLQLEHRRQIDPRLPCGRLSTEGLHLPLFYTLRCTR